MQCYQRGVAEMNLAGESDIMHFDALLKERRHSCVSTQIRCVPSSPKSHGDLPSSLPSGIEAFSLALPLLSSQMTL